MPIVELTDFDNPNCVNEFFSLYTHIPYYQTIQPSPGVHVQLTFLKHNTPFSEGRQFQGLLSRDGKRVVTRAVAVHDQRYNQQWGERLGHLIMFEALPSSWGGKPSIGRQGMRVVKEARVERPAAGFGPLEYGFVVEPYKPSDYMCAQYTPSYYHALIKSARIETEKGAGEYTIEVSEDLVFRCRDFLKSVQESGYDIRPLKDIPAGERTSVFTTTWNQAFSQHWGLCTMTESEFESIFEQSSKATQVLDLSAIAYRDGEPVGTVLIQKRTSGSESCKRFLYSPH